MKYLGNAFSAGMLAGDCEVTFTIFTLAQARNWVFDTHTSCVGHTDTALLLSALLDTPVAVNRCSTELHYGDELLIAQYNGPRLPEGATSLPEGAKIRWILARVSYT